MDWHDLPWIRGIADLVEYMVVGFVRFETPSDTLPAMSISGNEPGKECYPRITTHLLIQIILRFEAQGPEAKHFRPGLPGYRVARYPACPLHGLPIHPCSGFVHNHRPHPPCFPTVPDSWVLIESFDPYPELTLHDSYYANSKVAPPIPSSRL